MKGEPEGTMIGDTYFHESSSKTTTRAVVLLTDVFGLPLVNCKLMADEISKKLDCDVWIPDLFAGSPLFTVEQLEPLVPDRAGVKLGFWSKIRFLMLILPRIHRYYRYMRPIIVDAKVDAFVSKIKDEKKYEKIGAVGYCFGGSCAIRLGSKGLVDSLVIAHPGGVTAEQVKAIKIPSSWECAEEDPSFDPKIRLEAESIFAARKDKEDYIDYEFVDYPGTAHGFAARPNLQLPEIVEAYNKALEQTISWFKKTL